MLQEFRQDAGYAMRGMRSSPGFTAVAIVSLALGIGADLAIFSLIYTTMLRALPVDHPEQLVELLQKYPGEPRGRYWTKRSYDYYRGQNHVFSSLAGVAIDNRARLQPEASAEPEFGIAEYVTPNYFLELGLRPALGHSIDSGNPGVVISWALWERWFHRDPGVVGKRIFVKDKPVEVIGVAPREYAGPRVEAKTDVWLPSDPEDRMALIGRLKPGVTIDQAQAEMTVLYRFTIEERAANSKDPLVRRLQVEVEPCGSGFSTVRDRFGKPLTMLMAAVGVLLLLACVNVAGLLLARGAGRAPEISLRLSLGASRGRLARQMLTESLMLSGAGALAGVAVAYFGTKMLVGIMASGRIHERIHLDVHLDGNLMLFGVTVAVLTGLLFGLAPAWHAFRSSPSSALRQSGRSVETRFSRVAGKGLLAAQVALSVLLLSSAGLFISYLRGLEHTDFGFRPDHVLLVTIDASKSELTGERLANAYHDLLGRVERIPGVRLATLSSPTPLLGAGASAWASTDGFEESPDGRRRISITRVAPKYFATMETPILAGREFTGQDHTGPRVAIINRTLAQRYFAGRDPIGKRITLDHITLDPEPKTFEIVGVAGDASYLDLREADRRVIYIPAFHEGRVAANTLVIRTGVTPERISGDVRQAIRDVAAAITVPRLTTLTDQIAENMVAERLIAMLSGFFGVLGALLAAIGIYGLLAYTVTRRMGEIGIRLALGATATRVVRMVLSEALTIVGVGLTAGVPMAIWGRDLAANVFRDIGGQSGAPLALGAVAILAVALLASYAPARRAAQVDPMVSLRHE